MENRDRFPPTLCKFYLNGKCSKNDNCSRLHICKEYLISSNRCTLSQSCGLSHNLFDTNNKKIIMEYFDESFDENEITEILRESYPKLCINYASMKKCENDKCFQLHLCTDFVFGNCTDQYCGSCHDYISQHNQQIFESFNLAWLLKKRQHFIVPNILSSKLDFIKDISKNNYGEKLAIKEFKNSDSRKPEGNTESKEDEERRKEMSSLSTKAQMLGKSLQEIRGNVLGVPQNYSDVILQIKNVKIDTADKLEQMAALIYEKAINKPTFSALYAKVCRELSECAHLANVPTDHQQKSGIMTTSFRILLLDKCQKDFEAMMEAQTKAIKTEKEEMTLGKEFDCEERMNHHRLLRGNIKFIGELFKLRMISEHIIHNQVIVVLLRRDNREESHECLCELLSIVGKDLDHPKGKMRMDQYFQQMNKFLKVKKISTHIKSAFQDVMELRQNNWIHHRQEKNYTTINLVGKEVEKKPEKPHRKSNSSQGKDKKDGTSEYVQPCKDLKTETVIAFILQKDPKGGKCPLHFPEILETFFNNSPTIAENWFKKHKSHFRTVVDPSNKRFVHVCMVDVEPCHQYWRKTGCTRPNCGRFHICRKLLFQPHNANRCKFNHDLQNEVCQKLLENNNLSHLSSEQIVTLLRKRYPLVCSQHQNNFCSNGDSKCDALHICKDFVNRNCSKDDCCLLHDKAYDGSQAKRLSKDFNIPLNVLKTSLLVEPLSFGIREDVWIDEIQNLSETVDLKPVRKDDIIQFIMNLHPTTGDCQLNNPKLLSYFDDNIENAEIWFRKNHSSFRMSKNKQDLVTVHVCLVDVEPCKIYWSKQGCNVNCGRFHVCRKLLFEKHNANACSFNHKFDDSKSCMLIEKNNLQKLLPDELVTILKNRFPFVCKEYQTNQCQLGEKCCESLHVCVDHLSDNCDGICSKRHDDAFQSEQAKRICTNFSLKEDNIRRTILYEMVVTMITDSKTFNPMKEEAICLDYLNGDCHHDSRCTLHHYKTPFMWQYKPIYQEKWIDFSEKANKEIEKMFCDPHKAKFLIRLSVVNFNVNFHEINELGCFKDNSSQMICRRLSTRSTVYSENEFASAWKWYWKKLDTEWDEYSLWIDSETIEKAYLSGNMYCQFTTDEFTYHIMFDEMKQQNRDERYFTKRDVIRRPEYQDVPRKSNSRSYLFSSRLKSGIVLPKTWPSKCTPGHLINVSGTQRDLLEKSFLRSVSTPMKVIKIQEVCNEEFYEKYLVKKKQIENKGQTSDEKFLYHGTSHDTVAHICAQNFDFRMSGKNATAYGKGSYFSTSACYSHRYTNCDSVNQRFMFVAQVLVGKYTKGDSSYTRPPPLHHGSLDLYDSCVDDVSKPSMYIIFDRDQCYPRYLITYELSGSNSSASAWPSNGNQHHLNNINPLSAYKVNYPAYQVNASAQPLQVNRTPNSQTQPVTSMTPYAAKNPVRTSPTHNSQKQPSTPMTTYITKKSQTPSGSPVKSNPPRNSQTKPGTPTTSSITKNSLMPSVYPKKASTFHNSQTLPGTPITPFVTKNIQTPSGSSVNANPPYSSQTQPVKPMTSANTKNSQTQSKTQSNATMKSHPINSIRTQANTPMTPHYQQSFSHAQSSFDTSTAKSFSNDNTAVSSNQSSFNIDSNWLIVDESMLRNKSNGNSRNEFKTSECVIS